MKIENPQLQELILALTHIGLDWREIAEINRFRKNTLYYRIDDSIDEDTLFQELVGTLKLFGLKWRDLIEDYRAFQLGKPDRSSKNNVDYKPGIYNF